MKRVTSAASQQVQALIRRSGGQSPSPEAEAVLVFGRSLEAENLLTFLQF